jgi:hypothetical protein
MRGILGKVIATQTLLLIERIEWVVSVCRRRSGVVEGSHPSSAWRGSVTWRIGVVVVAVGVGEEGAAGGFLDSSPTINLLSIRSSSQAMASMHTHSTKANFDHREVHLRGLLSRGVPVKARISRGSELGNLNSNSRRRIKVSKVLQKEKSRLRVRVAKGGNRRVWLVRVTLRLWIRVGLGSS